MPSNKDLYEIDASTFQKPLVSLAETLAQKLYREVPKLIGAPPYVSVDLFVLMRQAMYTYNLLCFVNADERRQTDSSWDPAYTFVTLPLIRSMVDILYNVTYILLDPAKHGGEFRQAGYKKELSDLEEDKQQYGGRSDWDDHIKKKIDFLDAGMRADSISTAQVLSASSWTTLGTYVSRKQTGGVLNPHQAFLKRFTHGMWREYSAMSHGGFEGLLDTAVYFTRDAQRHEFRPQIVDLFPSIMSLHMMRASLILLSLVTELQLRFHFTDANINDRISQIWKCLMPAYDAKELYDEHYDSLMKKAGITK